MCGGCGDLRRSPDLPFNRLVQPRRTALSAQGSQATNKGSINRTGTGDGLVGGSFESVTASAWIVTPGRGEHGAGDNGAGVGETTRLLGDDHGEVAGWDGAGNGGIEEVEEDGDADSASRVPISCLDDGGVVLYLNDLRLTEVGSMGWVGCGFGAMGVMRGRIRGLGWVWFRGDGV